MEGENYQIWHENTQQKIIIDVRKRERERDRLKRRSCIFIVRELILLLWGGSLWTKRNKNKKHQWRRQNGGSSRGVKGAERLTKQRTFNHDKKKKTKVLYLSQCTTFGTTTWKLAILRSSVVYSVFNFWTNTRIKQQQTNRINQYLLEILSTTNTFFRICNIPYSKGYVLKIILLNVLLFITKKQFLSINHK